MSEYKATSQLISSHCEVRRASFWLSRTSYKVNQSSGVVNEASEASIILTRLESNLPHLASWPSLSICKSASKEWILFYSNYFYT